MLSGPLWIPKLNIILLEQAVFQANIFMHFLHALVINH
jgi:hypothetical protein